MSLHTLPTELLTSILTSLPHPRTPTLLALALTSRKLNPLAESHLYAHITLHSEIRARQLIRALDARPERASYVRELRAVPVEGDGDEKADGDADVLVLVGRMQRLRALVLETVLAGKREGVVLGRGVGVERVVARLAWACLTAFTLHSCGDGDRFYDAGSIAPVFVSPTLRYLHVSCVNFQDTLLSALGSSVSKTPLETLILERCILRIDRLENYTCLDALLARPRALRALTLLLCPDGMLTFENCLPALQQQRESLEYLCYNHISRIIQPTHTSPQNPTTTTTPIGLSLFPALHTLDTNIHSSLLPYLSNPSLAPPSLHTLSLFGLTYSYNQIWAALPTTLAPLLAAPPFAHLRLHTNPSRTDFDHVAALFTHLVFTHTPHREILLRLAAELRERGREVSLVCAYQRGFAYPPYLFGERKPEERVVFDSRRMGRGREGEGEEDGVQEAFEMVGYTPVFGVGGVSPHRITRLS